MRLSIITVNFNNRDGLQKTIDSVIGQTWRDFEWIIIDGGSTDGSRELIEQYQEYFSYWCSEPDKGVYNAMNKGISKAQGEYLNFMNSGDSYTSSDVLYQVFKNGHNADILYGGWFEDYGGKKIKKSIKHEELFHMFYYQNLCHQSMFIQTRLLKEKRYDESFKLLADWARNTEMLLSGCRFEELPVCISNYDMYGMSNQKTTLLKEDYDRIISMYPSWTLPILRMLDSYKKDYYVNITRSIIRGNTWRAYCLKIVLKFLMLI